MFYTSHVRFSVCKLTLFFSCPGLSYDVYGPFTIVLKGDVIRDISQRRFLAQHSVAMLEQYCKHSKQCSHNVVELRCAKNRRCESSRVTSP